MDHLQRIEAKIYAGAGSFLPEVLRWKTEGKRLVFTNGCFDLLHRGHVEYLAKAASKGDVLVIGLNTDHSVSRLKGPGRPLTDERSRALVLASLQFVSAVVLFDEDTPEKLIAAIMPDLLIKGSDYQPEDIAGSQTVIAGGGKVETIELVAGYSTTALLEKIRTH
jgi:rfaE bifunctional protein nucleotidyltransferase chain/domain